MGEIDLRRLEDDAEAACQRAFEKRDDIGGAVNWGDLHCHEARQYRSSDGSTGYSVHIAECDPGASELFAFLARDLREHGWPEVEIYLEW